MESFATPYPVIFFDGELEQDKGLVGIHSALTYKRFQSLLSQKTGVPANQLSAVFVCRRTQKDTDKRQRLPINGNTNFSILLNQHNPSKERDCYFFVSVKKSKKERKGSRKRGAETDNPDDCADPSLLEERGQVSITLDEMASQEARSPHMQTTTVSTAVSNPFCGTTAQRSHTDGSYLQAAADKKIGRILLKRQVVGPNVASPVQRRGWKSAGVQGPDVVFVQGNDQAHTLQGGDPTRPSMYWREENFSREKDSEHSRLHAPFFLPPTPMDSTYHPYEAFNPERLRDSFGPSLSPSTLNLHRNGALRPGIFNLNLARPSSLTTSSPIFAVGASRIPPSSSGMAAFAVREPHFRRPNAQQHLQMQQQLQSFSDLTFCRDVSGAFGGVNSGAIRDDLCCEVCCDWKKRNVYPIPFHWCVQDEVTSGFGGPSPAGPIERPGKAHHVEAAA